MRYFITLFEGAMGQEVGPTRLIDLKNEPCESLRYHNSRAYFCTGCGRIWARWTLDQVDFVGFDWYVYNRTCPDHSQGAWTGDKPGSLVLYPTDIVVLPRSLLEAELLSYWRYNDNEQHTPSDASNEHCNADATSAGSSSTDTSGDHRQ